MTSPRPVYGLRPGTLICLSPAECMLAAVAGANRRIESFDRADSAGLESGDWTMDIEGAAGEMAVAKLLKRYWGGDVNTFHAGDVGRVQVRSTELEDGCLIVRPADPVADTFVLVVGRAPRFRVVGYISGQEARQERWWRAPNGRPGAWFVPQSELSAFTRRQGA